MSQGILRRSTDDSRERDISSRSVGFIGTEGPSAPQKPQSAPNSRTSQSKQCWICLMSDDEDSSAVWSRPCNCKGTSKWVHHFCLQRWVDEQQKNHRNKAIKCPQCKTQYLIFYPKSNALVVMLDRADALVYKLSPFLTAGILIGCIYWCATTYGAVATIQVAGEAEAKELFDRMSPSVFLTALPCIPLYLIAFQTLRWEDYCLIFLREISPRLPVLNQILPSSVENGSIPEEVTDGMTCTRIFTSALLLPTVAAFFGNLFFGHISQGVKRSIFGGLVFIGARGIIKMYHKQELYKRRSKRQILDYTEENARLAGSGDIFSSVLSENEIFNRENQDDIQTVNAPKPGQSAPVEKSIVSEYMKNEKQVGQPENLQSSEQSHPMFESRLRHSRTMLHSPSDDSLANKPQFHTQISPPESNTLLDSLVASSPKDDQEKMPLKSPPLVTRSPSYKDKEPQEEKMPLKSPPLVARSPSYKDKEPLEQKMPLKSPPLVTRSPSYRDKEPQEDKMTKSPSFKEEDTQEYIPLASSPSYKAKQSIEQEDEYSPDDIEKTVHVEEVPLKTSPEQPLRTSPEEPLRTSPEEPLKTSPEQSKSPDDPAHNHDLSLTPMPPEKKKDKETKSQDSYTYIS